MTRAPTHRRSMTASWDGRFTESTLLPSFVAGSCEPFSFVYGRSSGIVDALAEVLIDDDSLLEVAAVHSRPPAIRCRESLRSDSMSNVGFASSG